MFWATPTRLLLLKIHCLDRHLFTVKRRQNVSWHLDIYTMQKSHSNLRQVNNIMGFVSIKKRGVRHLPRWSVGHARQARRWFSGVQGAERSASSTEPCRQWGAPFASPPPGDGPREVTGERQVTHYGRHGFPHSTGRLPWDSCRSVWRRNGEGSSPLAGDALPSFGCTGGVPG